MQNDIVNGSPILTPLESPTFVSIFDPPSENHIVKPNPHLLEPVPKRLNFSTLGNPIFSSALQKKSRTLGYPVTRYYFLFELSSTLGS